MAWIIFRGIGDPPGSRFSMVHTDAARLVPQPPDDDGIDKIAVFQGDSPGVVAKKAEIQVKDTFDEAWQACQEATAGG